MVSILLILLCASCTTVKTQNKTTQELFMQRCDRLPELEGGSGDKIYPWALIVVGQYNECATMHNGWVDSVSKGKE